MGLSTKVASFTWLAADVATTTYDVTCGFQPEFIVLWSVSVPGSTDIVARATATVSIGFAKDGSNRCATTYTTADAATSSSYAVTHGTTAAMITVSTAGAGSIGGRLDVDTKANWPIDGIRFIVDTQVGADRRISILAIGGSDITAVAVGNFQEAGATGNQTIAHGLGVTPTGVLFSSVGLGTAPEAFAASLAMCASFGAFDGTNSWVTTQFGDDANTTMDNVSYAKTGECIAMGVEGVTTNALAAGVSFDSTNITINWTERAATRYCFYLAWVGGRFKVGSTTTATNTTPFSGPSAGFVSTAALFASACRAASTADTPTPHAQVSIGAATSASERVAHAMLDEDGIGTSEVTSALENDEVYINIDTASAIQGLMDISDMTVDPMQLVMDDADPSGSFVGMAMWGSSSVDFPFSPSLGQLALLGQGVSLGFTINMPDEA
jgi:hypothetical protein